MVMIMSWKSQIIFILSLLSTIDTIRGAATITEVIVLGDSLSDDGTLFRLTNGTLPPAFLYTSPIHSFSDGQVWHHSAVNQGLKVSSFAVAGSSACALEREAGALLLGLNENLISDLGVQADTVPQPHGSADTRVVVIWTGIIDILGSLYLEIRGSINSTTLDSNIASIVPCISSAVTKLLENGEKNIILTNVAPGYTTPLAAHFGISSLLRNWILPLNDQLKSAAQNLSSSYPSARILVWDPTVVFTNLNSSSSSHNFTSFIDPCLLTDATILDPLGLKDPVFIGRCPDPSNHVFWDNLHPSSAMHSLIGDNFVEYLQQETLFVV